MRRWYTCRWTEPPASNKRDDLIWRYLQTSADNERGQKTSLHQDDPEIALFYAPGCNLMMDCVNNVSNRKREIVRDAVLLQNKEDM